MPAGIQNAPNYVGPTFRENSTRAKDQEFYPHILNESPSTQDYRVEEEVVTDVAKKQLLQNPLTRVDQYLPMIEDHLQMRVSIFFYQLVCAFGSRYHFENGPVLHQGGGNGRTLYVDEKKKGNLLYKRPEAHSSTLPTLIAYPLDEWNAYKNDPTGQTPKPTGFIYMQDSDLYRASSSTFEIMEDANKGDSKIDGKDEQENHLRKGALSFLNKAAKSEVNPEEGLEKFVEEMLRVTQLTKRGETNPAVKTVLGVYEQVLLSIQERMQEGSEFFDALLNLQDGEVNGTSQIRNSILRIRYKAIRENQWMQSALMQKIKSVSNSILSQELRRQKTPNFFSVAFRALLLEKMQGQDRLRLSKLLNFGVNDRLRLTAERLRMLAGTEALIKRVAEQKITDLAKELNLAFRDIKRKEILERGSTTRALRYALGLTQKEFAAKLKQYNPQTVASQSTISRVERNERVVDEAYARDLSAPFGFPIALFMPAFFSD